MFYEVIPGKAMGGAVASGWGGGRSVANRSGKGLEERQADERSGERQEGSAEAREGLLGVLTYEFDGSLAPGTVVEVPLGRTLVAGVVVRKVVQPEFATKRIVRILYSRPLPRHLLLAARFIAEYYQAPIGSVVGMILPKRPGGRKGGLGAVGGSAKGKSEEAKVAKVAEVAKVARGELRVLEAENGRKTEQIGVESGKTEQNSDFGAKLAKMPEISLNEAQKKALEGLQKAPGATKLLLGVTGSGKTNVYLREAARAISEGRSVIVLVPEIALTSQLVRVFRQYFGERVVLLHSQQKETERRRVFEELLLGGGRREDIGGAKGGAADEGAGVRRGLRGDGEAKGGKNRGRGGLAEADEARVVIGPRSALFAPVRNLGLIIVDEEHEGAYYQENAPRYSAVRVASYLARKLSIPCILGSATPNLTDYYVARARGTVVEMRERAKEGAVRPEAKLIDLKRRENFSRNRYFSDALLAAMKANLAAGRQTLIFHNRRGSAPLTICESCGEEILCPNCFLPLTLHADAFELVCHTCEFREPVPMACPECGATGMVHKGFGTKLLENELLRLFPKARVRRFDADNRRGETLAARYEEVRGGEVEILVGTQTVAKGLDLPRLSTVGVVQADAGLALPDFAAEERVFQLLTQVIGRVGRGHLAQAEVFVQTFRPEHPVFRFALSEDYKGFAEYMLARRREAGWPPYRFVAVVSCTLKTERLVIRKIRGLAERLAEVGGSRGGKLSGGVGGLAGKAGGFGAGGGGGAGDGVGAFLVSPPMPAFHERTSRGFTWQLVVRSRSRGRLVEALSGLDKSFRVELDPPGLL